MERGIPAKDATLVLLAKMIQDRCGINYVENTQGLASKINGRVQQLGLSFWEYSEALKDHPREWDTLIELITINETYFFREEQQLLELERNVMPQLAAGGQPVRIWSAAASSGEEPYSLAMTLWGAEPAWSQQVQILGTDINKKVLDTAQKGWYHQNSLCFRRTSSELRKRFFAEEGYGFTVRPEIRSMVRFQEINLMEADSIKSLGQMDVIFCRNVLIYFDPPTVRELIRSFYQALKPGGYLFLGHAETLGQEKEGFSTIHAPSTFYYRKGEC